MIHNINYDSTILLPFIGEKDVSPTNTEEGANPNGAPSEGASPSGALRESVNASDTFP
jgi:hypothetical protein